MPTVSVIMPAYNAARTIGESIESVQSQSFADWELIICDDASTDGTATAVAPYLADNRVRLVQSPQNSGAAGKPRNLAMAHACGQWLAFLDADDVWLPAKLQTQLAYGQRHPEVDVVHSACRFWENGQLRRQRYLPTRKNEVEGNIYNHLIWRNSVVTSTVILKREMLNQIGGFDENLFMVEDHDLWIRISQKHLFGYVYEPLVLYRTHSSTGVFRSAENLHRVEKSLLQISERYTMDNPKAHTKSQARVFGIMGMLYLENRNKGVAQSKLKRALRHAVAVADPYALLVLKLLIQASL